MFDLSKQKIDLPCPSCQRKIKVALQKVAKQQTIICPSCSQSINLQDKGGATNKGIKDVNKAFKSLENTFKKLGK